MKSEDVKLNEFDSIEGQKLLFISHYEPLKDKLLVYIRNADYESITKLRGLFEQLGLLSDWLIIKKHTKSTKKGLVPP